MGIQARLVSLLVVAASVVLLIAYIHSLRGDIALETQKYNAMVAAAQLYAGQIEEQNHAILQLKAQSDAQKQAVVAAENKSANITRYYETVLNNFRKAYVPRTCEGAMQWQKQQIKTLLKGY